MRGLAIALALGLLLAGGQPAPETTVVRAAFDDVVDLTKRGAVKIADVPVGSVRAIELDEDPDGAYRVVVTMHVDAQVQLPAELSAELRKTAVLGERYVALVPDVEAGGRFESGELITDTRTVPEIEELVLAGSEIAAAVSADRLAAAIEAGAIGLGGRGERLGALIDDLGAVIGAYEERSEDLVRLVDGFDAFLAETGPRARLHGEALDELAGMTRTLREEDDRLIDALSDARELARTGAGILRTHRARLDALFTRMAGVTGEVAEEQQALDELFAEVAKHNRNTIRGVNAEHAQVVLDLIFCGVNDEPGHPIRACTDPPQGRPRPEVREPLEPR